MKNLLNHIRDRMLPGLISLIPLFAIALVMQKLWKTLTGAGNYLANWFGLQSLLGNHSVTVAAALLLVLVFYLFGWLIKFKALNQLRSWIENTVLQFIPGYLTY